MSRPPLSETQRAAVEHRFTDAVVTAGAGSGKTRVLAERFVHLVREHGLRVRDVAALTFTEKAAGEMRTRIAAYFEAEGLERERADVEFAPISTIHAFCARLLRLHAVEAGLDPQFHVLDPAEAGLLRDDALMLAENRLREAGPEVFRAYHAIGGRAPRPTLLALLEQLRGTGVVLHEITWHASDLDAATALEAIHEAWIVLSAFGPRVKDEFRDTFDAVLASAAGLGALVEAEPPSLAAFATARVATDVGDLKFFGVPGFTAARNVLAAAVTALSGVLLDAFGAEAVMPSLRGLLSATNEIYGRLKREQSALDFCDLELEARALLVRLRDAGVRPDVLPVALLVDEYQDTNPVQAEVLALLREGIPHFAVGDPKQSIYGFRGADVRVILRERERSDPVDRHALSVSYRAQPELVARINALGARLFAGDRAGVAYEPLEAGADFSPATQAPLELAYVDIADAGGISVGREAEAAWIARRIRALVDAGIARTKRDAKQETFGYGDVAILLRARTDLAIYERALECAGVPHLAVGGTGYFDAKEIRDLIYVLRVIHDPSDEYALACVATGPVMAATDADLLRWFGHDERAFDRMRAEAASGGPHAYEIAKLEGLRLEAINGRVADVVAGALAALGLLEVALAGPGGRSRAANLRKAIDIARRMDAAGRRDLGDLLRHLSALRGRDVAETEAALGGADAGVVRLLTVHAAKGLEFPVVFLADVGRRSPSDATPYRQDGLGGVAVALADPLEGSALKSAGFRALEAIDKQRSTEESLRLFYVAATRAEEHLVVSTSCKGVTKEARPSGVSGWGRLCWDALGARFEHGEQQVDLDGLNVPVHVVDAQAEGLLDAQAAAAPEPVEPTADDREAARVLRERTAAQPASLGHTRYVVSVSELLTFASSPAAYYREVVLMGASRAPGAAAADARWDAEDPAGAPRHEDPTEARRRHRAEAFDEPAGDDPKDHRAAIGRAVHAAIERLRVDADVDEALAHERVRAELPVGASDAVEALVREMVERFLRSETGHEMVAGLEAGRDVRREVDFHARIRFPRGERVGGFDSLLVKGSIDLWLPTVAGLVIVDHKTNQPSRAFPTPEAVAAHYAVQLQLYALAAERLLGQDVSAARLVLLDPGFGPEALEVPIDVSGEALRGVRRLCRAFAVAELERRYPEDVLHLG